jgi:hypothetical protein
MFVATRRASSSVRTLKDQPDRDRLALRFERFSGMSLETCERLLGEEHADLVFTDWHTVPPPGSGPYGMAPWEYSIAELLSDAGYATAMFGKWHLGDAPGRLPTDQGFDEWWVLKNSWDEAGYTSYPLFKDSGVEMAMIWEGKRGQRASPVMPLDLKSSRCRGRYIHHSENHRFHQTTGGGKEAVQLFRDAPASHPQPSVCTAPPPSAAACTPTSSARWISRSGEFSMRSRRPASTRTLW